MRSVHRRPRRSSAAISGRPVVEPRTRCSLFGGISPTIRLFLFAKHSALRYVSETETIGWERDDAENRTGGAAVWAGGGKAARVHDAGRSRAHPVVPDLGP